MELSRSVVESLLVYDDALLDCVALEDDDSERELERERIMNASWSANAAAIALTELGAVVVEGCDALFGVVLSAAVAADIINAFQCDSLTRDDDTDEDTLLVLAELVLEILDEPQASLVPDDTDDKWELVEPEDAFDDVLCRSCCASSQLISL